MNVRASRVSSTALYSVMPCSLQVLVAEIREGPFLTLIVDPQVVAKFVLDLKLDHIVRVQVPGINRVLAVVVDRDIRDELGGGIGDYAAHHMDFFQHVLPFGQELVGRIRLQESRECGYRLGAIEEPWLSDLRRGQQLCKERHAVVIEGEDFRILLAFDHNALERLLNGSVDSLVFR